MDERNAVKNILKIYSAFAFEETLIQALCECNVEENMIVEQICKHCNRTPENAKTLISLEKNFRVPIRALQKYLEENFFFPPDSKEAIYDFMLKELFMKPYLRKATPEQLYLIYWPDLHLLKDGMAVDYET